LSTIAELPEGSGVAVSRLSAGRLWAHNDSGDPSLVVLDSRGAVSGRVRVSGAKVEDWEAVAIGPCPSGSCIYVGDIGDNDAARRHVTIYRIAEPDRLTDTVAVSEVFHAAYPDGAQNAETLLVTPAGEILIVTKGDTGPVRILRVPKDARPGETVQLEAVGKPRDSAKANRDERITDGAIAPGGAWVALRSTTAVSLYHTEDLLAGNWQEARRIALDQLREPQGEGITFADDRTMYLVGEGGGKSRPGTFGRLTCAP
jgi:hypothetical protein